MTAGPWPHERIPMLALRRLSTDSWHGQRIGDALAVEINDGVMGGLVEGVDVRECLVGEVIGLKIAPDRLDFIEFGGVFRQPLDGEPVCAGGQGGGCRLRPCVAPQQGTGDLRQSVAHRTAGADVWQTSHTGSVEGTVGRRSPAYRSRAGNSRSRPLTGHWVLMLSLEKEVRRRLGSPPFWNQTTQEPSECRVFPQVPAVGSRTHVAASDSDTNAHFGKASHL